MTQFKERLRQAKAHIMEIDAQSWLQNPQGALIDVRSRDEAADGIIQGANVIPRGTLEWRLAALHPNKTAPITFYCAAGSRSAMAASVAKGMGYERVRSIKGGFAAWKALGAPFVRPNSPQEGVSDPETAAASVPIPTPKPITATQLQDLQKDHNAALLLDLREPEETDQGLIPQAIAVPRGMLDIKINDLVSEHQPKHIVLISSQGQRAALAAETLAQMEYSNTRVLQGGMDAWRRNNGPLKARALSATQRQRYSRHLLIPEVGPEGQQRLLQSRVLLVGAGGLGSPVGMYLAAAGVGTLGIIDSDVVDRSNLQRQILHTEDRVGTPKVTSAAQSIAALNPDTRVRTFHARLTRDNIDGIFKDFDLIVDGGDNFPTRYLVNDACIKHGLPCVHGSVYRFEGQVTVFNPGHGPCYRCLYPTPPPPELAPNCAQAGVLGVIPGIIGLFQATEVLKILLNIGQTLQGRLVHFDALSFNQRELKLGRDPDCPACGDHVTDIQYIDYDDFCRT